LQGTREVLRKHVEEFGDLIRKENEVALIIDGKVIVQILPFITVDIDTQIIVREGKVSLVSRSNFHIFYNSVSESILLKRHA
jgi:hypothetical protein